jgi:hypothetical protein
MPSSFAALAFVGLFGHWLVVSLDNAGQLACVGILGLLSFDRGRSA